MSERAKVGSLEAIESFRASLIVYIANARAALEEVSGDVTRTQVWLESDQRRFWESEIRRRHRMLEEAQQALFTARLSQFSDGVSLEQLAVQRARRAMQEADEKLRTVKRWDRDFESIVQPLVKQMEKLHTILSNDMVKAVAELDAVITTISSYAQTAPPKLTPPAESASAQTTPGPEAATQPGQAPQKP